MKLEQVSKGTGCDKKETYEAGYWEHGVYASSRAPSRSRGKLNERVSREVDEGRTPRDSASAGLSADAM